MLSKSFISLTGKLRPYRYFLVFVLTLLSQRGLAQTPSGSSDNYLVPMNLPAILPVKDNDAGKTGTTVVASANPSHGTVTYNANGTVTYQPATGFYGQDRFEYKLRSSAGVLSASIDVRVAVRPAGSPDAVFTPYNTSFVFPVITNDVSKTGTSVFADDQPLHGSLVIDNATREFTYAPFNDFCGYDTFHYKLLTTVDNVASEPILVTIGVRPLGTPDVAGFSLNTDVAIRVKDNDLNTVGTSVKIVAPPTSGTIVLADAVTNTITYRPNTGFTGTDTFTYALVTTDGLESLPIVVKLIKKPAGTNDYQVTTTGLKPVKIAVKNNDESKNGTSVILTSNPTKGTAVVNADNTVTYTPAEVSVGHDVFTYQLELEGVRSNTIYVGVILSPAGTDDQVSVPMNTATSLNVLANDPDGAGSPITIKVDPSHGTAAVSNAAVTYRPVTGFHGKDSFKYYITKNELESDLVTVFINVKPAGTSDTFTTGVNTPAVLAVKNNDAGAVGCTVVISTSPSHGSVVVNPNGTITYTPAASSTAGDSFFYILRDEDNVDSEPIAVALNIALLTEADVVFTDREAAVKIAVKDNDVSKGGTTVLLATAPMHGSAIINGDGTVTYTPVAGFYGADSFKYVLNNASSSSANTNVTIYVRPRGTPDAVSTVMSTPVNIAVKTNDPDTFGTTVVKTTSPVNGTATVNADNTITYIPAAAFHGKDTFSYLLKTADGSESAPISVTVSVIPSGTADVASVIANSSTDIQVKLNDEGKTGTVVSLSTFPEHGTATVGTDGVITYKLAYNSVDPYTGLDKFTYTLSNLDALRSAPITVTVQVKPSSTRDIVETLMTQPVVIPVTINDLYTLGTTVVKKSETTHGTVVVNANNTVTYTPVAGYLGQDAFSYVLRTADGVESNVVTVTITVINPVAAAPTIVSFTPSSAEIGTPVTITGTNLTGTTAVTFGGVAGSFLVNSSNSITAVMTTGTSGSIEVTTPAGKAGKAGFTSLSIPQISYASPKDFGSGDAVVISGSQFKNVSQVKFGGVPAASFVVGTNYEITAIAGTGASGAVEVITPGGTATYGSLTYYVKPTIASFSPSASGMSQDVLITGTNLAGIKSVLFGGKPAASWSLRSPTLLVARPAYGSQSGDITVIGFGGTVRLPGFTFIPGPEITAITPSTVGPGDTMEITGKNFTGITSVQLTSGGVESFTVNSPTSITAKLGSYVYGTLVITAANGTATFEGPAIVQRTYISSVAPSSGKEGDAIIIYGANFDNVRSVSIGGVPVDVVSVFNSFEIRIVLGKVLSGEVKVVTDQGIATKAGFNFYLPPSITSFTPGSAKAGGTVVIKGKDFTNVKSVKFGNMNAASFKVDSAAGITATIGNGASGDVSVTTLGGTTSAGGFTFINIPAPALTSVTPTVGIAGTVITLTGTNLNDVTSVTVYDTKVSSFTILSPTTITAVLAPSSGLNVGLAMVNSPGGSASIGFRFIPTPGITSFSPAVAKTGTAVTIYGSNFKEVSGVTFGDIPAASYVVSQSGNSITAIVGQGASGEVKVATQGGNAVLGGFKFALPPVITSFSPTTAKTGDRVVITGENFIGLTTVYLGSSVLGSYEKLSDSSIAVIVPSSSTSGEVSLTALGGRAALAGFTFIPAPTIASFSPTSGTTGTAVTITGTNFTGTTSVTFGGVPVSSFTVDSPTKINVVIGAGAAGPSVVNTPGGTATQSGFTFLGGPSISSFSPYTVKTGTTVTITGTNFTGATAVTFGGVHASSFVVNSATSISAVVGAGASGAVSVVTPAGTATRNSGFFFYDPPSITSFSPASAAVNQEVTIKGTHFIQIHSLVIGGKPAASWRLVTDSLVIAKVGEGAASGDIVLTADGGTFAIPGFIFIPGPEVTSISPDHAAVGQTIELTGKRFAGVTNVAFAGNAVSSFTVNSDTRITVTVPQNAVTGPVLVTSPDGPGRSNVNLTIVENVAVPVITSFLPSTVAVGTTVEILGNNFLNATAVNLGTTPAASFIVRSATRITAVAAFAPSGDVTVTTPAGTARKAGYVGIMPPIVGGFSPHVVSPGDVVTIHGEGLDGATAVSFGDVQAASFVVNSSTSITAVVAGASSSLVTVVTPGGISTSSGLTFNTPHVGSFIPQTGKEGTVITITGWKLENATAVRVAGIPVASFTIKPGSPTEIVAVLANGVGDGSTNVSVTVPEGVLVQSGFVFIHKPVITSFAPLTAKAGDVVTLTGYNFTDAASVSFGNTPAASFTVNSPQSITAVISNGASGDIAVTAAGGTASFPGFTFGFEPAITSFLPTVAKAGTAVTITGTNFTGANAVSFGGVAAASFVVNSSTSITAVAGTGASGQVKVVTPLGTAAAEGFEFAPIPVITSFSPASAGRGTEITITGTGLGSTTAVAIGGVAATSFTINSPTSVSAIVPVTASGPVSITTVGGTATKTGFSFIPPPELSSFTPEKAKAGTTITIYGFGFTNATAVSFGGIPAASFTVKSTAEITAVVGTGESGEISVTARGGTVTKAGFTFIAPPVITSFTPATAKSGDAVTITGDNFTNASMVTFGNVNAASFIVNSPKSITAIVRNGASGEIAVTTEGGKSVSPGFTYIPPPVITGFAPLSARSGVPVTITGTGFSDVTSVTFGGTPAASFVVNSATSITAVTANGSSGVIQVSGANGTAALSGFTFVPPPAISSFAPSSAKAGATVTITGTNLTGVTAVRFGGVAATSFVVSSPFSILAVVAAGASGDVSIVGPGGSASTPGFTYLPPPVVTSFTPSVAKTGSVVTITGTNLDSATSVRFSNVAAASFTVNSTGSISALVGEGASGEVTVVTPTGTAQLTGFTFMPVPAIAAGQTTFATGGDVTLRVAPVAGLTIQWARDGADINGATDAAYVATQAGSYTVSLVAGNLRTTSAAVALRKIFTLPASNFRLLVTGETCRTSDNGSVKLTAAASYNYTATLVGPNKRITLPFTTTLTFGDLAAGAYTLEVTVEGQPDYKQLFQVTVTEPKDLALIASVNADDKKVILKMAGGAIYYVQLNGESYSTADPELTLPLVNGVNQLTVSTDKDCQGAVTKMITLESKPVLYPNPVEKILTIADSHFTKVYAEVRTLDGKLVISGTYISEFGVIEMDLGQVQTGVYLLKLVSDNKSMSFKIIKK
ncbi:IPT/TIG domain-containing protein [Hufsiella ginkgonis]|uniref:Tandem-95 repeat protein n=1 Tax=Hufsiella ginkgonis TaxID=2695274 RepID=A0A7K1XYY1_9SPHI|nr:IPT/TIG domain-containing protein [Hufsiella ginkgonis]MXV16037.1 tandem-95 repeat protein [Hufsiella ginkgonis]